MEKQNIFKSLWTLWRKRRERRKMLRAMKAVCQDIPNIMRKRNAYRLLLQGEKLPPGQEQLARQAYDLLSKQLELAQSIKSQLLEDK